MSVIAVSYTHLDVYKRQFLHQLFSYICTVFKWKVPNPYQHNACKPKKCPASVSYTHLDVYKRQESYNILHTALKYRVLKTCWFW